MNNFISFISIRNKANSKIFLLYSIVLLVLSGCSPVVKPELIAYRKTWDSQFLPMLERPFGTICEMKIEIVDGQKFKDDFPYIPPYLIRVIEINNEKVMKDLIIWFKDETGEFPNEMFGVYKHVYGEEVKGGLSVSTIQKMNEKYIGQQFRIAAYETGEFFGEPKGFHKYKFRLDNGPQFHFENYLMIIANLDSKKEEILKESK